MSNRSLPIISHTSRSNQPFTPIKDETLTPGWYISPECMQRFGTLKIEKRLGQGAFGSIHDLCDSVHCDKVVKIVPLSAENNALPIMDDYIAGQIDIRGYYKRMDAISYRPADNYLEIKEHFETEVAITKIAAQLGVSPRLHDAFICSNNIFYPVGQIYYLGFILLDKWDLTLQDYLTRNRYIPAHLVNKLIALLEQLHSAGIYHGDLGFQNIVLRLAQNVPIDVAIIDYGLSNFINSTETEQFARNEMAQLISRLNSVTHL